MGSRNDDGRCHRCPLGRQTFTRVIIEFVPIALLTIVIASSSNWPFRIYVYSSNGHFAIAHAVVILTQNRVQIILSLLALRSPGKPTFFFQL
jgi:predicted ATP-grasp superfamily ATP-dependent carboligase